MSWGMCICSKCHREIHQNGESFEGGLRKSVWQHCEDNTPICESATAQHAQSLKEVSGRYCGCDGLPGQEPPW